MVRNAANTDDFRFRNNVALLLLKKDENILKKAILIWLFIIYVALLTHSPFL